MRQNGENWFGGRRREGEREGGGVQTRTGCIFSSAYLNELLDIRHFFRHDGRVVGLLLLFFLEKSPFAGIFSINYLIDFVVGCGLRKKLNANV